MKCKTIFLVLIFLSSKVLAQSDSLNVKTEQHYEFLFRNCANEIRIIEPSISEKDSIKYACLHTNILLNKNDPRIIGLVPFTGKVYLQIYRNNLLIGIKEYSVRIPPDPLIEYYADGNLVGDHGKDERVSKTVKKLTIKAKAEEFFALNMPKDARYIVTSWKVFLIRGDKQIDSLAFNQKSGSIKKLISKSEKGDKLYIEVCKVLRKNYLDRIESVSIKPNKTRVIE